MNCIIRLVLFTQPYLGCDSLLRRFYYGQTILPKRKEESVAKQSPVLAKAGAWSSKSLSITWCMGHQIQLKGTPTCGKSTRND